MVECWNNACTNPELWAIDTGKNNNDLSKLSGVNIRFVRASGGKVAYFFGKILPVVVWFGIWIFVSRVAKKKMRPKLLDLSLIMLGIPATMVMWWVISFAL